MAYHDVVHVLAVSPFQEDYSALDQIFRCSRWIMTSCRTCAEASAFLEQKSISVVLCEERLSDGSWKDILEHTRRLVTPPPLIVAARLADERLWSEVLNLGGYDLLNKPFQQSEVFRGVAAAVVHWENQQRQTRDATRLLRAAG